MFSQRSHHRPNSQACWPLAEPECPPFHEHQATQQDQTHPKSYFQLLSRKKCHDYRAPRTSNRLILSPKSKQSPTSESHLIDHLHEQSHGPVWRALQKPMLRRPRHVVLRVEIKKFRALPLPSQKLVLHPTCRPVAREVIL